MAFDVGIAGRVREYFLARNDVTEKKMFGGICFMVAGPMCCGVDRHNLMLRVGQERYEYAHRQKHARPMDFTGKPLRGFVFVSPEGIKTRRQLERWLSMALANAESLPAKKPKKRRLKRA